ncbi:TetR/AcrR family transcriptional regulator [Pedobacter sp. MR2016-19]|uniref:TetR/AcrR family transcriptional regulator n=1 Tax=Pedobacter sp. MR2016-19 TaxID=2780089 RepID=UPI001873733C|nr:TetR/AcrR family transcriptional regulator [Pedobacter sp. MR2016-19]MBE5320308.1 TetR/AcrR family transcriptional regulator [Pedobacter sp. MR2016-19]
MENPYKRKKEPEVSKQLILAAAAEIGVSDWHRVTFQAIADKTGLSKGGIIHHFRNKEDLLKELMNQSLAELTEWIIEEKKSSGNEVGSLAYLRFIIGKSNDLHYRRTMKIVMQVVLINEEYRKTWDEWSNLYIGNGDDTGQGIKHLIMMLVADGLWYSDNLGIYNISDKKKQQILETLINL